MIWQGKIWHSVGAGNSLLCWGSSGATGHIWVFPCLSFHTNTRMAWTVVVGGWFWGCPVPCGSSHWLGTAISTAGLEYLIHSWFQPMEVAHVRKLLTFLEYVNLCALAKEDGREYYKWASFWLCCHHLLLTNPLIVRFYIKDTKDPSWNLPDPLRVGNWLEVPYYLDYYWVLKPFLLSFEFSN